MTGSVRFGFVPMGQVMEARASVIAVDVGGKCIPGVIDHHFRDAGDECAASMLFKKPGLVLDHLGPDERLRLLVMHRQPDLDCVVSAFLALHLAKTGELPAGAAALAEYTRLVDSGRIPDSPDRLECSLWGLYSAATHLLSQPEPTADESEDARYESWVRRGFELVELALNTRADHAEGVHVPVEDSRHLEEREFLRLELERFGRDRERARKVVMDLPTVTGGSSTVNGLIIDQPEAALFKHFARSQGFSYTHVRYPDAIPVATGAGWPATRHVLSVDPESDTWLKGLGAVLEGEEIEARAKHSVPRQGKPRWPDVTCADPWYDGRSPLHMYTIVDTPRGGTLLSDQRVEDIAQQVGRWMTVGRSSDRRFCPRCGVFADANAAFCPADGEPLAPAVVDGRFEILRQLGSGGMGTVFKALDRVSGLNYALKLMRLEKASSGNNARRFFSEAILGNRLAHPNLMRVVDVGADAKCGLYMVCELLDGRTLQDELKNWSQHGEFYPPARIPHVFGQICAGLESIHDVGVVHRDMKPTNVMLLGTLGSEDSTVRIMDYGLAIQSDQNKTRLTATGAVIGTPLYAAPEQLTGGGKFSVRTDIYAVGAMLYEVICGAAPFADSSSLMELLTKKLMSRPPSMARLAPHAKFDPQFENLVLRMLSKDPEDRPASIAEVQQALEECTG